MVDHDVRSDLDRQYGLLRAMLVAAVLAAIPAFMVLAGGRRIVSGVIGPAKGELMSEAYGGVTQVAIGVGLAVFAILLAAYGVHDAVVRGHRRSEAPDVDPADSSGSDLDRG